MFKHRSFACARIRRLPRLIAANLCALLLLSAAATSVHAETGQDYANQVGTRLVGSLAPRLKLTTVDGKTIDLARLYGRKAVYLKFWATWCVPCRQQMPHFEKVKRNAGDDLEVIGVNIGFDDTVAQINAYRRELGITMPIVRDDGRLAEIFGLRVTPQHVLIGRDGRIQYIGHLADAKLDAALARARKPLALDAPLPVAPPGDTTKTIRAGDTVPPRNITTLEAYTVALSDPTKKRKTALAFLSPWCESYFEKTRPQSSAQCRALRELLVTQGRDRRVRWIGIAAGLWASEQDVRDYRNEHRIPVPLTLDHDGALFRRFGIHRVPALIVVDTDGRIVGQVDVGDRGAVATLGKLLATP